MVKLDSLLPADSGVEDFIPCEFGEFADEEGGFSAMFDGGAVAVAHESVHERNGDVSDLSQRVRDLSDEGVARRIDSALNFGVQH